MVAFQSVRAPSQMLPANGGGTLRARAPIRPAPPVRMPTAARPAPATVRNPLMGNPIFASLAKRAPQTMGTTAVTPRAPSPIAPAARGTAMAPVAPPQWEYQRSPNFSSALVGTPVGGAPARGTLLSRPVPPPLPTGAPVSQSIPIQSYAGVPPAGTPPSMTFGPTQGVVPADAGGFTLGGPFFSVSGFQMNQTTLLLVVAAGAVVLYLMVK